MKAIRTLIADDEKPARRRLLELLESQKDVEVVGVAANGREAVEKIAADRPDLLFLDIQMPQLDGFGVLREVAPEHLPATVFVTAYDRYAIQAFEARAIDYLLKPYSDERFEAALEHARKQVAAHWAGGLDERLLTLLESAGGKPNYLERIVIKSRGRITFLEVARIDWIEAAGVYVDLHCGDQTFLYRSTIGQLQEKLDPKRFVRVHRSASVNTARIRDLQTLSHGEYELRLTTGACVKVSRKYRSELEQWLGQSL